MKKIFFILLLITSFAFSQDMKTHPIEKLKDYDISVLLICDSILEEDGERKFKRPEPLGFIGKDYQRFYIHFTSAFKNTKRQNEYLIKGKTRVKDNISDFEGVMELKKLELYTPPWATSYTAGVISGDYYFKEDSNVNKYHSGILEGEFYLKFYFDKEGKIKYDALIGPADSFSNNQFYGNWESYDKKIKMECNWGDFRIPKSEELDMGTGIFIPNEKYVKNGWQNYDKNDSEDEAKWWLENKR